VRLGGATAPTAAVYRPADGEPSALPVSTSDDVHEVTLPGVGVYAVVELTGVMS
jgi:hypothetical protein